MQRTLNQSVTGMSSGLPQQFENLAFPLMDSLYGTALGMTRDRLDAEDLVQVTYMKAYRFFHRFETGTNFRAWIFRILTNSFITQYNNKKSEPVRVDFETAMMTVPQEDTSELENEEEFGLSGNYDDLFDDPVTAALDRLPMEYRLAVLLADVNELKYKEIAAALDCPIGTVMSRISRGRKILSRVLRSYAAQNGLTQDSNNK
ncbi:MAG: sigma-70 family RNA polymerase sigma factor [bacterium]